MKINCLKENLNYGLLNVQKAVSAKKTLPVLDGILLKTENNSLIIKATDLEFAIETKIPADIIEEGEFVVTSGKFIELIKRLPDVSINLEKKDQSLSINYNDSNVELKGWDAEEFPALPDIKKDFEFTIKTKEFNHLIKKTIFASSADESRPVFNGALLQMSPESIQLITTDSHRLAIKKLKFVNEKELSIIIPRKTLLEVQRIFKDEEEEITIYGNDKQITFNNSDTKILSRIIDGKFPNFEQVIPREYITTAKINKTDFLNTIERAGLFIDDTDKISIVKLLIKDSLINISSKSETGNLNETINAFINGDQLEISFNSRYLIDALKIMDDNEITFNFSGSLSPSVITEDNGLYTYLVLPLRSN